MVRAEESAPERAARFSATLSAVAEVLKGVPGAEGWREDVHQLRLALLEVPGWRRFPEEKPPNAPRMLLTAELGEYNPTICYFDGDGSFFANGDEVTDSVYAWDFLPLLPPGPGLPVAVDEEGA